VGIFVVLTQSHRYPLKVEISVKKVRKSLYKQFVVRLIKVK